MLRGSTLRTFFQNEIAGIFCPFINYQNRARASGWIDICPFARCMREESYPPVLRGISRREQEAPASDSVISAKRGPDENRQKLVDSINGIRLASRFLLIRRGLAVLMFFDYRRHPIYTFGSRKRKSPRLVLLFSSASRPRMLRDTLSAQ